MQENSNYKNDLKEIINYGKDKNRKGKGEYSLQMVIKGIIPYYEFKKIQSGVNPVDRIALDRILYRIGLSPTIIETIITQEDYERYLARRQIYEEYYNENDKETEKKLLEYETKTEGDLSIHHQFVTVLRAKMILRKEENLNQILRLLESALSDTVVDWEQALPSEICLAPDELEIILMMAECYFRKRQKRKARKLIKWVLLYFDQHIMEKDVWRRFLPLAYLEYSKVCEEELALYYVKIGILLCYQTESLFYLIPLQNHYLYLMGELEQRQKLTKKQRRNRRRVEEERQVILDLCKEVGVDWKKLEPTQTYYNTYLLPELLKQYREYLGQSKREFSADLCTENAYDAVEKGISIPRKKFTILMKRMGMPTSYIIPPLHGVTKQYMDQKVRVNELIRKYHYKEAEVLFEDLESIMKKKRLVDCYPRNKQFFIWTNTILKGELKHLPKERKLIELKNALQQTMPEYPKKNFAKKILLEQEAFILNSIAITYREQGNYEKAMEIWEGIRSSYQQSKLCQLSIYSGYEKMKTNYVSCIGSMGNYKQSTQLAYETIKWFLEKGTMRYLARLCYGITWNQEQEIKLEYGEIKKEEACLRKFRHAQTIAKMTNDVVSIQFFNEQYRELYGLEGKN